MRKRGFAFGFLLSLCFVTNSYAAELAPEGTRERKFQRGLLNTALAPLEITHALKQAEKKDALIPSWMTAGFGGTVNAGIRAVTGLYEILTAPIPWPRNYRPIYRPEWVTDDLKPPMEPAV